MPCPHPRSFPPLRVRVSLLPLPSPLTPPPPPLDLPASPPSRSYHDVRHHRRSHRVQQRVAHRRTLGPVHGHPDDERDNHGRERPAPAVERPQHRRRHPHEGRQPHQVGGRAPQQRHRRHHQRHAQGEVLRPSLDDLAEAVVHARGCVLDGVQQEDVEAVAHVPLGERDVLGEGVLHRLVRAHALVRGPHREDELAGCDRFPGDAGAVDAPQVARPGRERQEDVGLHQPLPERHHLLAREQADEVHALRLKRADRARHELRGVLGVGVDEEQQLPAAHAIPLHYGPWLPEPPGGELRPPHQAHAAPRLRARGDTLDDRRRVIGRAVVHHHDLDRLVGGGEDRSYARFDILRLVPRRDDHGDQGSAGARCVIAQLRAAHAEAAQADDKEGDVRRRDQPGHASVSPSAVATTAAPVRCPVTLASVRNMSGTRSRPIKRPNPASGKPVAAKAGARLTTLPAGTAATVSAARTPAAPACTSCGSPNGRPYSCATNNSATAWNSALPGRLMLAPSGSTKLDTVREILRSPSAAPSIVGSVASEDVVENAIIIDGNATRRKRGARSLVPSATAGTNTPPTNSAMPRITARMNTPAALTSDQPNCATAGATSAQIPSGATARTQYMIRMSACVAASATLVSAARFSAGSVAVATAKIVTNTISGSSAPSTAARSGLPGTRFTRKLAPPDEICSAAWRASPESAAAAALRAVCCSGLIAPNGSRSFASPNPITIAASVVSQKKASVRAPRRPTFRMSPSPATPVNRAVATRGITTIERRLRNTAPTGRRARAAATNTGACVTAAARPSASPAPRPTAIHTWLRIAAKVLIWPPPRYAPFG